MSPSLVPYDPRASRRSLFQALLEAHRRHGGKTQALVDLDDRVLDYDTIVKGAFALGHALKRGTRDGESVGVLNHSSGSMSPRTTNRHLHLPFFFGSYLMTILITVSFLSTSWRTAPSSRVMRSSSRLLISSLYACTHDAT